MTEGMPGEEVLAWMKALAGLTVIGLMAASAPALAGNHHHHRPFGDTRILTEIPATPGFPEGIAVDGNKAYVVGPAAFDTTGFAASTVWKIKLGNGNLVDAFTLQGEDTAAQHATSGIAFDREGRAYVLNNQLGVLRMNVKNGNQRAYAAAVPDIPLCSVAEPGDACSDTVFDRPPLPNDMVFDRDGYLYVSDSFQAAIFIIPPRGGAPELLYSHPLLDGDLGINGLRFDPDREYLYFAVSGPANGAIYRLALDEIPFSEPELVHAYTGFEGPDGIAFGRDGLLYVSLAVASQISILDEDGIELNRIPTPVTPESPYANPSGLAFDGDGSLLVVNHAIFDPMPADKFALFDVWVDDKGDRLDKPRLKRHRGNGHHDDDDDCD